MRRGHLTELCAGTAAVGLCALVGHPVQALTGYMGAKRRWAPRICAALGFGPFVRPSSLHLVDAGPWGEVWSAMAAGEGPAVAELLRRLEVAHDDSAPTARRAVLVPPSTDRPARVAQYLVIQARSPGCIPVWWDGERWTAPTGSRTQAAHERGSRRGVPATEADGARGVGDKSTSKGAKSRGLVLLSTLRRRVETLAREVPWERVTVTHGLVADVVPTGGGAAVFFDPPYRGCPRYAALLVRDAVMATITRWRGSSRVLVVSEAEGLDGGEHIQIAPREWLTVYRPPALELVPVSRDEARAFVRKHHRHLPPPVAEILRVGATIGGELVAVATAGRPVARHLDDGRTLEVTRLASAGAPGACSRLYGALARAASALGWTRLVTYTRADEPGTSPAAAGFRRDGVTAARGWDRAEGGTLFPSATHIDPVDRIRWLRELRP